MLELPYSKNNVKAIDAFLATTKERMSKGVEVTFTSKASSELMDLSLEYDIKVTDIEQVLLHLKVENYYRGIDISGKADYNVCAFGVCVGTAQVEIYLKYGLERAGKQILIFSNHPPRFQMNQPFKK